MNEATADFVAEIDAFLSRSGMKATAFGKAAVGDPSFLPDIRKRGRAPSLRLVQRVRNFIQERDSAENAA